MADTPAFIPIEEKHGEGCTCAAAGHISIDLVAASRACPGDRNPHRAGSIAAQLDEHLLPMYPGSIAITWGATNPQGWQTAVHDYITGQLLPAGELRLALEAGSAGFKGPIVVEAKLLVDRDGRPLMGESITPVPDPDNPHQWCRKTFRCHVSEMRTQNNHSRTVNAERAQLGLPPIDQPTVRLVVHEAAGHSHASQTTKPIDHHGRAIKESRP